MLGPEGLFIHSFGPALNLLGDGLKLGGLFDSHFYFFLSLQHLLDVLVHHNLELLQLLVQNLLLVRVFIIIEESLDRQKHTNCCL